MIKTSDYRPEDTLGLLNLTNQPILYANDRNPADQLTNSSANSLNHTVPPNSPRIRQRSPSWADSYLPLVVHYHPCLWCQFYGPWLKSAH